jgi:hypothetical protein
MTSLEASMATASSMTAGTPVTCMGATDATQYKLLDTHLYLLSFIFTLNTQAHTHMWTLIVIADSSSSSLRPRLLL